VAPGLGALAAAYVLILAVAGPLIARAGDPLGRWVAGRAARRGELRARRERAAATSEIRELRT